MALNALTANYTDSEEEHSDDELGAPGSIAVVRSSRPSSSQQSTPASAHGGFSGTNTPVKKGVKAHSLVPYFDATIVEEHEAEEDRAAGRIEEIQPDIVIPRQRLASGTDGYITEDEEDRSRRLETEISNEEEELKLSKNRGAEDEKSPGQVHAEGSPVEADAGGTESTGPESERSGSPPPTKVSRFEGLALPAEPSKECPKELENYFSELFKKKRRGIDPNKSIVQRKDFRNPSLYEKLVQFCELDEFGSNFPPHVYNPTMWGPESFYDELAKAQKADMDRREKERRERTKVEVVSGTARKPTVSGLPSIGASASEKKSKWDQVGVAGIPTSALGLPPGVVVPGARSTVIPAFGLMKKK